MRPVYGIEVAQEFIAKHVGVKTKLTESYLFGLDKVKYTIMVLQDMCRMDILFTDQNLERFCTNKEQIFNTDLMKLS